MIIQHKQIEPVQVSSICRGRIGIEMSQIGKSGFCFGANKAILCPNRPFLREKLIDSGTKSTLPVLKPLGRSARENPGRRLGWFTGEEVKSADCLVDGGFEEFRLQPNVSVRLELQIESRAPDFMVRRRNNQKAIRELRFENPESLF